MISYVEPTPESWVVFSVFMVIMLISIKILLKLSEYPERNSSKK